MDDLEYFYPYSAFLKNKYKEKVYKLPVNLPVTCPNRLNGSGCTFCSPIGTGFEAMDTAVPVPEQLYTTREHIRRKYNAHKFIAYFQNYTNTFLPTEQFREYMIQSAQLDDIVEISVSTRPDCISKVYLDILKEIQDTYHKEITIELGLQSANHRTLTAIQRGHSLAEFIDAVLQIQPYGFDICAHVILNLPTDDLSDCIETAKILSALKVPIIKIHSLYIAKNTPLCESYENGTITLCSKEEYYERLIAFLEYLSPKIGIERLFSRVPEQDAVFSNWGVSWWRLKEEVLSIMTERHTYQGRLCHYLQGAALQAFNFQVKKGEHI